MVRPLGSWYWNLGITECKPWPQEVRVVSLKEICCWLFCKAWGIVLGERSWESFPECLELNSSGKDEGAFGALYLKRNMVVFGNIRPFTMSRSSRKVALGAVQRATLMLAVHKGRWARGAVSKASIWGLALDSSTQVGNGCDEIHVGEHDTFYILCRCWRTEKFGKQTTEYYFKSPSRVVVVVVVF